MIYISIAVPLFFLSLFTTLSRSYNKYSYLIGYFFILILVFIASLRYKTGTDYESYSSIWRSVLPLNKAIEEGHFGADYLEFGFLLFTSFIKIFSENSLIFFTSMSFLTLVILYKGLHKLSNINIYIAITLYFMMFYMGYVFNGMRQAVSMSLLIYSLTYIINGNLKKTFIITAIATSFHSTGFLIIISYFLTRININIILYFLIGLVLSIIFYYFNFLGSIIDLLVGGKFSHYIEFWGDTSLFQMTTRILLAIFFMFISIKVIKTNFFINITKIYLLGFFIYIALLDANMMATRFNMFFRVLEIVMFSMVLYQSKFVLNRIIVFIFAFSLAILTFYLDIMNDDNIYQTLF